MASFNTDENGQLRQDPMRSITLSRSERIALRVVKVVEMVSKVLHRRRSPQRTPRP